MTIPMIGNSFTPRQWQKECLDDLEIAFEQRSDFLVTATPGAGKTSLALAFAFSLIRAGRIDHVHVVAPTRALRKHWQDEADLWGIRLGRRTNRSLRNGRMLPMDVGGVATTFAQIAADPDAHAAAVEGHRTLVILDECHHSGDSRAWGEGIKDAFEGARFRLHLSGTPFRQDGNIIPYITYLNDGFSKPDFPYSYSRAIKDDACRPVVFNPYNALGEYVVKGQTFQTSFTDDVPLNQMSERLRYALHPQSGLIEQMVRDADDELQAIRSRGPRWSDAAGLLVCMSIEHAHSCARVLESVTGEEPMVVASDGDNADDNIKAFKNGMGRWIVAVKMVSEGVDIPRLMVAVYATNTIATLFFRQFVGRVVRVRHRGMEEVASVYLPGDERLTSEAEKIEAEVQQFLRDEPAKFPAVRNAIADRQKQRANIVPMMRSIERDPSIYRGETFTEAELSRAEALRPSWPLGDRLSAAQIAFAIRQVEAGAA